MVLVGEEVGCEEEKGVQGSRCCESRGPSPQPGKLRAQSHVCAASGSTSVHPQAPEEPRRLVTRARLLFLRPPAARATGAGHPPLQGAGWPTRSREAPVPRRAPFCAL